MQASGTAAAEKLTRLANAAALFHARLKMAQALMVMTWNLQQLPPLAGGPGHPRARARRQAQAILDIPPRERPDVIAFNEAFDSDARSTLKSRLKPTYPYVRENLGNFPVDSGLMLFSKRPFKTLFNGKTWYFDKYKNGADWDQAADKGIAIVRIDGPNGYTQIAFTHTQSKTQYANIRAKQFKQVCNAVKRVSNYGDPTLMANTILMGDLNVKGDANVTSGEVIDVFSNVADRIGSLFHDTWPVTTPPPGTTHVYDPGFTHQKDTTGLNVNRLDYICMPRAPAGVDSLSIQHMGVAIRPPFDLSDHWAMHALVHAQAPNGTPSEAIDILVIAPTATAPGGERVWNITVTLQDPGTYAWHYMSSPGTYTVFTRGDAEASVCERTSMSKFLTGTTTNVASMPPALQSALAGFGAGEQFICAEPVFLRLRSADPALAGIRSIAIVKLA